MKQRRSIRLEASRALRLFAFVVILGPVACTSNSHSTSNQSNANQSAPQNAAQSKSTNSNSTSKSDQPPRGSIEVTSSPSGARVLLVANDESGAGEPQAKGITPTKITGLAPGKYTVDLEKPGYRFFQREVDVKGGSTAKVAAVLKKQ